MIVGIDFGTSTSEISYVNDQGQVVLIPNHLGEVITPSAVYLTAEKTPVVGQEAKEMAIIEPENVALEVKRLFGQGSSLTLRGTAYTPVAVASMIIEYLVKCAEEHLGCEITAAVITVPAYFTDAQRRDVMLAGEMAGLKVERIINEPTAASLDYGIRHMQDCKHILVYDLGGGTLDVTVLELFEGVVDVKSSCGNNTLGGKDFDQAIMEYALSGIMKKNTVDIKNDARAMTRLKISAEQCKIALSEDSEYKMELPFLFQEKSGEAGGYSEVITRNRFEQLIEQQVYSTRQQIETALCDAKLIPSEIDLVLLVGGSTRIPLVSEFLSEQFGFDTRSVLNPDLAVVRGAAIQAGVISGVLDENAIILTDVSAYSLSVEVLDKSDGFPETYCDVLIPRNTTLPASISKVYCTSFDNQTTVHITTYQGESLYPEENELLNRFSLSQIPKGRAGKEKISIRFEYDLNGILVVSAEIISTGKSAVVTLDTAAIGAGLDLEQWKNSPYAKSYRAVINKADRMVKVHGDDADAVEAAAQELKKAIILGWETEILVSQMEKLKREIEVLEDELL